MTVLDDLTSRLSAQLDGLEGQWVAVSDDKVVAHSPNYENVLHTIRENLGVENCTVFYHAQIEDFSGFKGEWVAVINGKVVAHARNYADLLTAAPVGVDIESSAIFRVGPSLFPSLFTTSQLT